MEAYEESMDKNEAAPKIKAERSEEEDDENEEKGDYLMATVVKQVIILY